MANLTTDPDYLPTPEDRALEHKLSMLINAQVYETDRQKRREICAEHARLHATRSPEYVRYLEQQKGIYRA